MTNVSFYLSDNLLVLLQFFKLFSFSVAINCSEFVQGFAWKPKIMIDELISFGFFGWNFKIFNRKVCMVYSGCWTEIEIIKIDESLQFREVIHHYKTTVNKFDAEQCQVLGHHDNFPDILVIYQDLLDLSIHHKLIELIARDFLLEKLNNRKGVFYTIWLPSLLWAAEDPQHGTLAHLKL